jgi:uncharacterized protein YkwD
LLAVAAAAGAAMFVLAPGASHAATTAPALTVSASRSDVKVSWKFTSDQSRDNLQLQIQRGPDATHFADWLTAKRPRSTAWRMDRRPLSGANLYRARIVVNGVTGAWGATASINATGSSGGGGGTGGGGSGPCANARADILRLVNQARAAANAPALNENSQLDSAAQTHSQWMHDTGIFSHTSPTDPQLWVHEIRNAGYPGGFLGQNIAMGYPSSSSVMDAWMHSAGHKANILNPGFRDIGIGCVASGGPWWTQDFGG